MDSMALTRAPRQLACGVKARWPQIAYNPNGLQSCPATNPGEVL